MTVPAEVIEAVERELATRRIEISRDLLLPILTAALAGAPVGVTVDVSDDDLKRFGYAPGGYMVRCSTCGQDTMNVDKRATCCRQCALDALATSTDPVSVPAGWKPVPVEPTEAMESAGNDAMTRTGFCAGVYRAMLAAAHQPAAPPAARPFEAVFHGLNEALSVSEVHARMIAAEARVNALEVENERLQRSLTDEVTVRLDAEAENAKLTTRATAAEARVKALEEVFLRWKDGYGYNEDSDEDVALAARATLKGGEA